MPWHSMCNVQHIRFTNFNLSHHTNITLRKSERIFGLQFLSSLRIHTLTHIHTFSLPFPPNEGFPLFTLLRASIFQPLPESMYVREFFIIIFSTSTWTSSTSFLFPFFLSSFSLSVKFVCYKNSGDPRTKRTSVLPTLYCAVRLVCACVSLYCRLLFLLL